MSLKPTVILVGKAVARRAQELLCDYTVAVMQNVKPQLLERISRMTGAMMLPSTDHMIQQYGEECLGSCALFWLRCVMDDPEKIDPARPQRVLRAPISRGSTYAYLQGCPPELGCTLVLRCVHHYHLTFIVYVTFILIHQMIHSFIHSLIHGDSLSNFLHSSYIPPLLLFYSIFLLCCSTLFFYSILLLCSPT